ncbi:ATP phosphoribosyltransferase regulatory subunit [Vallitalea okinawensis]|uniref:ATP phosphoribosyltransferase regulatory subunit n=1 Tax=Vallitalea okinawensis TaxID=2078660 RepID=UPI000CFE0A3C|nr:ATP phosphoribosyltransferase regulatory subunit [Vallitalea okinawensis]
MNRKFHTPEGVKDFVGHGLMNKKAVVKSLENVFLQNGFEPIETPTLEFIEVYSDERAHLVSNDMYKVLDRKGNVLVLKPDFTPAIARAVSHLRKEDEVKVYSIGQTFRYQNSFTGKANEMTQAGVEWVGDQSLEVDVQLILLAIESLLECGLEDFQIDIGEVNFFKGLLEEGDIEEDMGIQLQKLIDSKNYFAIEEVFSNIPISKDLKKIFLKLPQLFGGLEIINEIQDLTNNEKALDALQRLSKIYHMIRQLGYEKYIAFDLSMVKRLDYYTGVLFRGVTYGTGNAILLGGRYDELLNQFANSQPAIGFGINIDELVNAMDTQNLNPCDTRCDYMICYDQNTFYKANLLSRSLKRLGKSIDLRSKQEDSMYYEELCLKKGIAHYIENEETIDALLKELN